MKSGAALGRAGANAGFINSALTGFNSQGYGDNGKQSMWQQMMTDYNAKNNVIG
jgi:hypothetical protein